MTTLPDLPILEVLDDLRVALGTHGRAIVSAPPGAGKTTVIPLALLDEPWRAGGRIVVLEPRRLATRAAARRMAELAGRPVGDLVGYQTRDERVIGRETRVEVLTEGVLTRRLQNDPELPGVAAVLFDEVHERNLTTDLGLALTLDVASTLRPDLRIVAMSATADTASFARLLATDGGPAPILESDGRVHPIDIRWSPRQRNDRLDVAVSAAVERAATASKPATCSCSCRASARSCGSANGWWRPSDRTSTFGRSPVRSRSRTRISPSPRPRQAVAGSCSRPTSPRRR